MMSREAHTCHLRWRAAFLVDDDVVVAVCGDYEGHLFKVALVHIYLPGRNFSRASPRYFSFFLFFLIF